MLKPRTRVTVVATVGGGVYQCTVSRICDDWFEARGPSDRMFGRKLDEENLDWARGWKSEGATALRALAALEQST